MINKSENNRIRKAIIPVAGNGTRMFPETFFIKKAMLPIMDEKGIVKPALLYMLEELVDCGIEDIYLIVGKGEIDDYERFFKFNFDEEYERKLPEKVKGYYKTIHEIGHKIQLVVQMEKKGFGHAVYQARQYLSGEPVLLLLGDFLYKSNTDISCVRQTLDAYEMASEKTVVSIREINVIDSRNYGVLHGKFIIDAPQILNVDTMVEKPSEEYAKLNMLVDGKCYATFGSYILTDEIFEYVGKQIENKALKGDDSETDLTGALMNEAIHGRLVGVNIDGKSFDIGQPEFYYSTFLEFGKHNC